MDKPISIGDLVQVVRWPHTCFPKAENFRPVFKVLDITAIHPKCPRCLEQIEPGTPSAWYSDTKALPITWLKRIPPIEEVESEKQREEIAA